MCSKPKINRLLQLCVLVFLVGKWVFEKEWSDLRPSLVTACPMTLEAETRKTGNSPSGMPSCANFMPEGSSPSKHGSNLVFVVLQHDLQYTTPVAPRDMCARQTQM